MRTAVMSSLLVLTVLVVVPPARGAEDPTPTPQPTPTPTPRPSTLAELAKDRELNTEVLNEDGTIVIIRGEDEGESTSAPPAKPEGDLPKVPGGSEEQRRKAFAEKKEYWQKKYVEQVALINLKAAQVEEVEKRIPELQNKFYSWDDPAYRDGVIKPALDRALEDRERFRTEMAEAEKGLIEIKQAARRDGALPGWFRGLTEVKPPETGNQQQH